MLANHHAASRRSKKLIQMAPIVSTVTHWVIGQWVTGQLGKRTSMKNHPMHPIAAPADGEETCAATITGVHLGEIWGRLLKGAYTTHTVLRMTVRIFYLIREPMGFHTRESNVWSILICPSTKSTKHYIRSALLRGHSQFWPRHSITRLAPHSLVHLVTPCSKFCL